MHRFGYIQGICFASEKGGCPMLSKSNLSKSVLVGLLVLACVLTLLLSTRTVAGRDSENSAGLIARGAATTIIHGGTGSPSFLPVITTVAFHAERSNGGVTGEFDCLAFAPEAPTGAHSGRLRVNAMYVVGTITGASVHEDIVTLNGVSIITGLGVGTNVPFTFIAHRAGPGASAILPGGT